MKKHDRSYRLTDTGIRIPSYKIKRMSPVPTDTPTVPATQHSDIDAPINIWYIDKLSLTSGSRDLPDCGETIVVDDWKEVGSDDK